MAVNELEGNILGVSVEGVAINDLLGKASPDDEGVDVGNFMVMYGSSERITELSIDGTEDCIECSSDEDGRNVPGLWTGKVNVGRAVGNSVVLF